MGFRGRRGRWIDPAEMPVGAAVNDIDAAMGGVPEDQDRDAGHVEFRHRVADRELPEPEGETEIDAPGDAP